ncbi:MAG: hypothetical protein ABW321_20565, partial [Polyangiales bacterium]
SLSLITIEARVDPFAGSFFLSGGIAWQRASLSGTVRYSAQGEEIEAEVLGKVNVPVLKLGLGLMGRSGFVFGADLGIGIQLGSNTVELSTDLPRNDEVIEVEARIRDRADAWVRALPMLVQLNLIRLGFLF